ncbi:MAG: ChaN family lipoprotein [Phycisphaerales bacterium]|nr:ChaN family lipoprotein [Phycisphaerales bacterium]
MAKRQCYTWMMSSAITVVLCGCAPTPTGGIRVFDLATGRESSFDAMAQAACESDVVLFGEAHYDPICNGAEADLYDAMLTECEKTGRAPTILAMEFFETDTQPALDAYVNGAMVESDFVKQARQGAKYPTSHRPLIELAKRFESRVVAANTPRRIVKDFRESGVDYADFRPTMTAEDQALSPPTLSAPDSPYRDRFLEFMRGAMESHGGGASDEMRLIPDDPMRDPMSPERMFLTQSLWDESMSRAVARARAESPGRNVLLVVGGFHVERGGGTTQKLRTLRPQDRILVVRYRDSEAGIDMTSADEKSADFLIVGQTETP